jgi:autotransporter-associated beta strand protein
MAHNTVRCVVPEPESTRDQSGVFQAFGSSSTVDYAAGSTSYGLISIRHVVFMKGDYMVVWDQITAAQYADWFFHTPADTTRPDGGLEWQPDKVISHTKWGVDLDIHFLLPADPLPAPTVPTDNLSIDYTTKNGLASQHPDPGTATLFTRQGDGRFGEWTDPNNPSDVGRDPWALKWQRYLSVRSPTADGDFLTILHPRKVGVTPALTSTLISSSDTGVSLTVNYNGRVDTILIDTSGATITRGTDAPVRFAKTWPQSGVAGGARLVKADESTTTLTAAIPTTGTVDVTLGTLALGNSDRVPDAAPVAIRGSGTLDLGIHGETAGPLLMDNGTLTGTGTLRVGPVASYGGEWNAPVISTGILTVHGGKLDLGGRTHLAAGLTVGGVPLTAGTYNSSNLSDAFSGNGNLVVSSGIKFWNASVDNQWNTPTANWTGQTWNNGDSAVISHTSAPSSILIEQPVTAAAVLIGNGTNNAAYHLSNAGGSLVAGTILVQGSAANDWGAGANTPARFDNLTLDVSGNLGVGRWPLVIGGTSTINVGGVIGGGGIATSPDWGTLTIQDDALVTTAGGIHGNAEAWALNLDGGTLFTPSIQASDRALAGSSARLTFNGSTVVATSNNDAFVTVGANHLGSNSALVGNGGAIIDSNGKTIGIGVNLKASGTGGLTKLGAGTLTLSGANTYSGGTTVQGSGRLDLASSSAAGTGTVFLQSTQTGTGVTLGIAGGITVDNPMAMDAATGREWIHFTGDGDAIVNGDMTISNGGSALVINSAKSSGTAIWNGDITGAGFTGSLSLRGNAGQTGRFNGVVTINSNLDHNGGGNWVVNAAGSNYAATRFQNSGSILLGGNNGLDTSARVFWSDATKDGDLDLNGFHASVAGLDRPTTTSDPIVTNNGSADSILTLAALEADRSFAGRITDGISNKLALVMNSPGRTQTLSGVSTHTGTTSVSGGTLRVTGSMTGTSRIAIAPNAILDHQGTISTGAFTHAAGGILKLNTAASLTVAGEVSLSGTLDLSAPAGLAPGASFTVIGKTGAGDVSGQFTGLPEGCVFQAAGYDWHVGYTGGDGNDVVVTVATALQSWRFLHFGTMENTGPAADLADSNKDGEANLLEFATAQNPHAATLTTTTLTKNGTSLEFTYTRSHAARSDGVTFSVEWSDTLAPSSWSDAGVTEQILSDNGTVQSIKASMPAGDGHARFVHLRVTAPPDN